jgi:transposase
MQAITTVGLDIAKSVFQVHAIDAEGNVIVRRQLKRRGVVAFFQKLPPCLVGIEACASSHQHVWSQVGRNRASEVLLIHGNISPI